MLTAMSTKGPSGRGVNNASQAPQRTRAGRAVVAEAAQQRGLAYAGLPTDEHHAPMRAALHGIHALAELFELVAPLEQLPGRVHGRRSHWACHDIPYWTRRARGSTDSDRRGREQRLRMRA